VRGLNSLGVEEEREEIREGRIRERIGKETLMVCGSRDVVSPVERARSAMEVGVEGGLKGGLVKVEVLDAGHWIMLERPEEVNEILRRFLEDGVVGNGVKAVL
jgi:pimeloyl-ACP methyl ester carboxylesterase